MARSNLMDLDREDLVTSWDGDALTILTTNLFADFRSYDRFNVSKKGTLVLFDSSCIHVGGKATDGERIVINFRFYNKL